MRPALKPKSAGFYQIPGPQITPNTPVAYWVDGTGQMWYSGSKSVSAPPSPAPIPTNENEPPMRKEKPCTSRTLSREELFQDDNFAKVLAAVESNPSATVCPAPSPVLGEHSATDDAMYSNALVLLPPPTTLPNPTTTLPRGTTTWVSFLVLFLAIIICTEYCVQFFQLEHAIRPKSASGGVSEAAVPSLPPVPWMRIVYTTVDDNAKSYTAIVDTVCTLLPPCKHLGMTSLMFHVLQSRLALSKTSPVVCGTIRGRASGTYATSCVAPSSTYPPSEQAEFVVVGLQTDDYMFTAVSWDENGKKVVLTSSFKCTHSSPMSAISITATTI